MATARRAFHLTPDSILTDGLDDSTIADLCRLSAYLNTRWARNRLSSTEAGKVELDNQACMLITHLTSARAARARILTLACRARAVSLTTVLLRRDKSRALFVKLEWPKFVEYQGYEKRERPSLGSEKPESGSYAPAPAPAPAQEEEEDEEGPRSRSGPQASDEERVCKVEVMGPPPKEGAPLWQWEIYAFLSESRFLNHPDLFDWGWWEDKCSIFERLGIDIDVMRQLGKMESHLQDKKPRTKNFKRFVGNWLKREMEGKPWEGSKPEKTQAERDAYWVEAGSRAAASNGHGRAEN